ncbi:MAG: crossover junction endodeoxyribonuclease RuvC [Oscillospiraceae bacterium]
MRILGIDPGFAIVGYGICDYDNVNFKVISYGAITTDSSLKFVDRLEIIYNDLDYLIKKYEPTDFAVEKIFFNNNQKTVIDVSQARGVILLAAIKNKLPVFEYTPLQVKLGVVGYGKAEKKQVIDMVKNILKLKKAPKPDDTADALAVAICHGNTANSVRRFY